MVLETHMKLCVTEPNFPGKFFCPKNWENGPKMGQKTGFFEFIGKFSYQFFLNVVYNFCIVLVRNGRGLLGLETPKSAVSQE